MPLSGCLPLPPDFPGLSNLDTWHISTASGNAQRVWASLPHSSFMAHSATSWTMNHYPSISFTGLRRLVNKRLSFISSTGTSTPGATSSRPSSVKLSRRPSQEDSSLHDGESLAIHNSHSTSCASTHSEKGDRPLSSEPSGLIDGYLAAIQFSIFSTVFTKQLGAQPISSPLIPEQWWIGHQLHCCQSCREFGD